MNMGAFPYAANLVDNCPKFLVTLDDFPCDYNGIQQTNLIDWLHEDGLPE